MRSLLIAPIRGGARTAVEQRQELSNNREALVWRDHKEIIVEKSALHFWKTIIDFLEVEIQTTSLNICQYNDSVRGGIYIYPD